MLSESRGLKEKTSESFVGHMAKLLQQTQHIQVSLCRNQVCRS